jgi:hypothetical protein
MSHTTVMDCRAKTRIKELRTLRAAAINAPATPDSDLGGG